MSLAYEIEFCSIQRNMMQSYYQYINNCEILVVTDVPSLSHAIEIISEPWIKNEVMALNNISTLNFKINEILNEEVIKNRIDVKFSKKMSILITFESTIEKCMSKVMWKVLEREKLYFLDGFANYAVIMYCKDFILSEIKNEKSGILMNFRTKTDLKVHELGSTDSLNLLMIAVKENNYDAVKMHLAHGYHVDYEDNNGHNAIDHAWINFLDKNSSNDTKDISNRIIISLLEANSKFPNRNVNFSYKNASIEVKQFVDFCENLHKIHDEDMLYAKVQEAPYLYHFYDTSNKSLLASAVEHGIKHQEIFKIISFGNHEDFSHNSHNIRNDHILKLRSYSKISGSERNFQEYQKLIDDAFNILDSTDICSQILEVAATWKKLKILFDFKFQTSCFSVLANLNCANIASSVIYIGAKDLIDDDKKYQVIAVMIHEFCHLAIHIALMNDSYPYLADYSQAKRTFEEKIVKECERNKDSNELIKNIFKYCPKIHLHAELIAIIPQILIKYPKIDNHRRFADFYRNFFELYEYCVSYIVDERFTESMPVLRILQNESYVVEYKMLTKSMKFKLLHGKIIFQGMETSFYECIGNNKMVLELVNSNDIKDYFIHNKLIKVPTIFKEPSKAELIRRKFVKLNEDETDPKNLKNFMQIKMEMEYDKFFLLSDHSKVTRTATFEDLAVQLKQKNKNFWVSIINIKNIQKMLEDIRKKYVHVRPLTVHHIFEIFKNLTINSMLESKIFTILFYNNKVIFLLDGIDDVSPENFDFLEKVLLVLKRETKNIYLISFQPQNAKRLEDVFKVASYRSIIMIYSKERRIFIENVLRSIGMTNPNERCIIAKQVELFIESIEGKLEHACVIDYKQMIEIITELFVEQNINSNYQLFELLTLVFSRQVIKVDENAKNPYEMLKLFKCYQSFALKSLIGTEFNDELETVKFCESEKHKWTVEKILSFGLLTNDADDKDSFDFTHKIYPNFLISRLILSDLFNLDGDAKDEDLQEIFKILLTVANGGEKFKIARLVLMDFMRNGTDTILHTNAKILILIEVLEMFKENYSKLKLSSLEFWAIFLRQDAGNLRNLWQVDEKIDLMKKFLLTEILDNTEDFIKFIELTEYCFGKDWHETFNKSGKKLITDEEIQYFDDKNKCFFKLVNYVDENFTVDELPIFHDKLLKLKIFKFIDVNILNKILLKFKDIYKTDKPSKLIEYVEFYTLKISNEEGLLFFCEKIEEILEHDVELVRQVLFHDYSHDIHPFIAAIKFESLENFLKYKELYRKYKNSYKELQDIVIQHSILFEDISFICNEIFPSFENFLMEIFESDKDKLKYHICRYFEGRKKVLIRKDAFGYMKRIVSNVFSETEIVERKIYSKFTCFNDFIM